MATLPFLKMHGLGNDFVVVDDLAGGRASPLTPGLAKQICDRRFGVGADQILWLRRPHASDADARMEILNADGSTAEMCGNGIRAVAIYLNRHAAGLSGRQNYRVETLAGMKLLSLQEGQVRVDMGPPGLGEGFPKAGEELQVAGETLRFFEVNMGNPHAVFFTEDLSQVDVEKLGPLIEFHPRFPKRTNVEFVQVLSPQEIQVRVWERGAGITLACGTGACASAVASLASGRTSGTVKVNLPGGSLRIGWAGEGLPVMMEGPAEEVFRGEFYYEN